MFDLIRREPVRAYLYTVAVATLALLAALGVIDNQASAVIAALVAAALGVTVESARARVTPTPRPARRHAAPGDGGYSALELLVAVLIVLVIVLLALNFLPARGC